MSDGRFCVESYPTGGFKITLKGIGTFRAKDMMEVEAALSHFFHEKELHEELDDVCPLCRKMNEEKGGS